MTHWGIFKKNGKLACTKLFHLKKEAQEFFTQSGEFFDVRRATIVPVKPKKSALGGRT